MISLPQARPVRRRGRGFLSLVDFVHRSPMKISPWYVRLAPTQGFLLSLCAKAFASAVTLLQDFLCLFTRLSSAYPPFAFVLCSSSPWSPILGGLGSLNRIICVTWRILIFPGLNMRQQREYCRYSCTAGQNKAKVNPVVQCFSGGRSSGLFSVSPPSRR